MTSISQLATISAIACPNEASPQTADKRPPTAAERLTDSQCVLQRKNSRLRVSINSIGAVGLVVVAAMTLAPRVNAAENSAQRSAPSITTPIPGPGAVTLRRPAGTPRIATGLTNFHGQQVVVACSSCHATTQPNIDARKASDLDQFHQGMNYVHGNLSCLSCHNSKNYDTLRMADSRPMAFEQSMTLCSQCHGPQRRDYDMGLHGGMNGFWDLTKGGRTRNTCINCHDPHAPAFPLVMPVLPPKDRISVPNKTRSPAPALAH